MCTLHQGSNCSSTVLEHTHTFKVSVIAELTYHAVCVWYETFLIHILKYQIVIKIHSCF